MQMFLLALLVQTPSIDGVFVPVLHHAQRTPVEWLAELETTGGGSARAVWALHYSGDRSRGVVDGLERWLHESEHIDTRRAIDTVLIDWRVDVEPLTAARFADGEFFVAASDVLPGPPMLDEMSVDELVRELDSGDTLRIAAAFAALVRRRAEVERALVALVDVPVGKPVGWGKEHVPDFASPEGLRRWAVNHVGSAYVRALANELGRLESADRSSTVLRAIEAEYGDISSAAQSLESLKGERAQQLWRRAVGLHEKLTRESADRDRLLHSRYIDRSERASSEAQASLDRVFAERWARFEDRGAVTVGFLRELHPAVLNSSPLAERSIPILEELLERDDSVGAEALRILCHLRVSTPRMRERYLEQISAWNGGRWGWLDIACWPEHDDETLDAFTRVAENLPDTSILDEQLRFAGLLDGTRTPIVQRMIDDRTPEWLHWMVSEGFRGKVVVDEDWLPEERINALALNLATAADAGEDCTELEAEFAAVLGRPYDRDGAGGYRDYVQWGFFHARDLGLASPAVVELALFYAAEKGPFWPMGVHNSAAMAYLDTAELSIEHEVRALALLPYRPSDPNGWMGLALVQPIDGGVSRRKTAIELVPAMRLALYGGNVRAIQDVLAATSVTERDLDYLLATLQRGTAGDRISVLELIEEHGLDSPRIAEAVRRARDDLDDETAETARRLCAERGW